jgi:hypothetical protein
MASMLNLLSIPTRAVAKPQRRMNAGFPLDGAEHILALLAGLTFVGCGSVPNIPPSARG